MKNKILKKSAFCAIYIAVIVACVALDQLTKLWIFDGLLGGKVGNSVNVLGSFLRFEALYNEGAAFGIGQDDGANIVFFVITVVGIPLFCWLLWRSRTRSVWGQLGFSFIVGGTIGNAIDRAFVANESGAFFAGKVRDFISFSIFPPIFNVADSFLTVGVAMAILAIVFFDPDALWKIGEQSASSKGKKTDSDVSDKSESSVANSTATSDDRADESDIGANGSGENSDVDNKNRSNNGGNDDKEN